LASSKIKILRSFRSKKDLKIFLVGLKPAIFQIRKSETSKNGLETKTGLKDYIAATGVTLFHPTDILS